MADGTNPADAGGGRRVQAVQISCDIVEALRRLEGAGVTELASELDLSKGTVHTHLATLYDNELVVRDGDEYNLSLRFVTLGEFAKGNVDIYGTAVQETEALAEECGEVAQFMVEEHGQGVYLHKARGENAIQTASYAGYRKHLHCTALGKAILAHLPRERVDEIVERHGLPPQTDRTITDEATLHEELGRVREDGVAYDDEEILQGLRCVAAPIVDHRGVLHGSISVSGPVSRMKGSRFREELSDLVRGAANVIEVNAAQSGSRRS